MKRRREREFGFGLGLGFGFWLLYAPDHDQAQYRGIYMHIHLLHINDHFMYTEPDVTDNGDAVEETDITKDDSE